MNKIAELNMLKEALAMEYIQKVAQLEVEIELAMHKEAGDFGAVAKFIGGDLKRMWNASMQPLQRRTGDKFKHILPKQTVNSPNVWKENAMSGPELAALGKGPEIQKGKSFVPLAGLGTGLAGMEASKQAAANAYILNLIRAQSSML